MASKPRSLGDGMRDMQLFRHFSQPSSRCSTLVGSLKAYAGASELELQTSFNHSQVIPDQPFTEVQLLTTERLKVLSMAT
jgi:hypothetical protein